ncbi:MAG: hypothetical protein KF837_26950 [Labilithrix sp.]|nr:hypothetical protein [Labilithrix sp.]
MSALLNLWEKERKAWTAALGLAGCEDIHCAPLPQQLSIDAASIACLEPVLEQLPFLEIRLLFDHAYGLADVFASPAARTIRSLSFRAHSDRIDPEESGVALLRSYFGAEVLAALCASPNMAHLEELRLSGDELGAECAKRVAEAPFVALRRLSIHGEPIGDEGAAALASSPVAATLRTLKLTGCRIGDAGALALASSPHLARLEELDVSSNDIGPVGVAALRALPLPSLVM